MRARAAFALRLALAVLLVPWSGPSAQDCLRLDPGEQRAREETCRAAGGEWARFGAFAHLCGIYSCAARTADGGKPCRSRSECEYLCVARRSAPLGSEATGECAAVKSPFGCITQIDAGRIVGTVCMD